MDRVLFPMPRAPCHPIAFGALAGMHTHSGRWDKLGDKVGASGVPSERTGVGLLSSGFFEEREQAWFHYARLSLGLLASELAQFRRTPGRRPPGIAFFAYSISLDTSCNPVWAAGLPPMRTLRK